jgi:hypothetical protein
MFLVSIVVLSARVGYILQPPQELNPEPFPEMALPVNRQAIRDACSLQIRLGFLVSLGTVAFSLYLISDRKLFSRKRRKLKSKKVLFGFLPPVVKAF